MREETRRKLERALWRERFKKIGIGAAALVLIGAYFVYEDYDAPRRQRARSRHRDRGRPAQHQEHQDGRGRVVGAGGARRAGASST